MGLGGDDALWWLIHRIALVDRTTMCILDGEVVGSG